jgi:mitotic spindle assembly checkpoint protein MAD2B
VSDILIDFLEVAVHNVLYIRNIYPESIFVRRKKYGVPVQMSTHPYLNEYISECLKTIKELLKKNEVRKVTVTFFDETQIPVERFVFDILDLNKTLNQ